MKLSIFNTLTRKKEEFTPINGNEVRMYSCGPTVYNFAHIGNLRTYIFMDILRRVLKFDGYTLKGVMNITDVGHLLSDADEGEDKMAKAAKEQKKTPEEIAAFYSEIFFKDIQRLNIGLPEIIAKATDNIPEMIDYVVELQDKGFAYETSDGIYFDIGKFPDYGKLSRLSLEDQIAGARVEQRRKAIGMKQKDLLTQLQVRGVDLNASGLSKLEGQLRGVADFELKAIAEVLGVSVNWLLDIDK